jgi:predicted MFS family arabinose efflux permease
MRTLRSQGFRYLFVGQSVSLLGDGLFFIALAFAVLESTGSGMGLGLVFAAGGLTMAAFVLIGGVWADRLSRRAMMIGTDLIRMVVQATLAVLVISGSATLAHFVILNALYGTAAAFFEPAAKALTVELVPRDDLESANGLIAMARSACAAVGVIAGGLIVGALGPGPTIGLDAASFAASAIALIAIREPIPAIGERHPPFIAELLEGWRAVRSRSWLWMIIANGAVFLMLFDGPFDVVGPIVARDSLGGAPAWGVIAASFPVGMFVGGLSVVHGWFYRPMVAAGALFSVGAGSALLLAAPAPTFLISAAYGVQGCAFGIFLATSQSTLQRNITISLLSRVNAWDQLAQLIGLPLGFVIAGSAIALFGTTSTLCGMAACGFALGAWVLAVPTIRTLGRRSLRQ